MAVKPLDSSAFAPAFVAGTVDTGSDSIATVAADRQPAGNELETPKKASVLPALDTTGPFGDIKPLDALTAVPTTMPTADAGNIDSATVGGESATVLVSNLNTATVGAVKPAIGQGMYMTLGGVVAVVDGTPIYANQVLDPLKRELTVKARELDEKEFDQFARQEIYHQTSELIQNEQIFAGAYHAISDDDRKFAKVQAMRRRIMRVTAAGGSVETARRQALEEGEEFDEALKKYYHLIVYEMYQRSKIEPLIQVTANAMREFYRLNVDKLYSDKDKAQFRVIEIDPAAAGGMQAAMDKINTIRAKAVSGEDFTALAAADNDDAYLKGRSGNPVDAGQWLERNTYPKEEVEAALWKIQPGQITPVIQADHVMYIAKLEAKHIGGVKSFEDPKVQDDIYKRLRQSQFADLSRKMQENTLDTDMVMTDRDRMETVLDIAKQRYAQAAQH